MVIPLWLRVVPAVELPLLLEVVLNSRKSLSILLLSLLIIIAVSWISRSTSEGLSNAAHVETHNTSSQELNDQKTFEEKKKTKNFIPVLASQKFSAKSKVNSQTKIKAKKAPAKKEQIALLPSIMPRSTMSGTAINLATYYGPKILDDISVVMKNPKSNKIVREPYLLNVYNRTIVGVGKEYHQQASL